MNPNSPEGILLVDKPKGKTSFSLVTALRKSLKVKKIGHAGTLDPLATGLMVLLIGKKYTKQADQFLGADKEYQATVHLGISTESYDAEGAITSQSDKCPTQEELEKALTTFQGQVAQTPPMFSAKKVNGKKLYELARQGKTIERKTIQVHLKTELIDYTYPFVKLKIHCSKGTYIRSLASDLGSMLGCGGHLCELQRTKSGAFSLQNSIDGKKLCAQELNTEHICQHLMHADHHKPIG